MNSDWLTTPFSNNPRIFVNKLSQAFAFAKVGIFIDFFLWLIYGYNPKILRSVMKIKFRETISILLGIKNLYKILRKSFWEQFRHIKRSVAELFRQI